MKRGATPRADLGSPQGKVMVQRDKIGSASITQPHPPELLGDNSAEQINSVVSNNHTKDLHRTRWEVGALPVVKACLSHP